jgi:Zn-dependent protease
VSGLRIGRVAGVQLSVNWSVLVLCAFLVWTLSASVFPSTNPGLSRSAHVWMAVGATLGLLLALLLHELGHALAARREGMETEEITLWLFGGVARFKHAFPSAGAEFRVALAGPLVSLALGLLCVGLARLPASSAANGVEAWLAYINLSLFVFNMLPAMPLDGGRVLHGLLWRLGHDEARATRISAGIGRALAAVMIAVGLVLFLRVDGYTGVWTALIGWYLLSAANTEYRYAAAQRALTGRRVRDLMTPASYLRRPAADDDAPVLDVDEDAVQALDELAATGADHAVVVSHGKVVGTVAARDVERLAGA